MGSFISRRGRSPFSSTSTFYNIFRQFTEGLESVLGTGYNWKWGKVMSSLLFLSVYLKQLFVCVCLCVEKSSDGVGKAGIFSFFVILDIYLRRFIVDICMRVCEWFCCGLNDDGILLCGSLAFLSTWFCLIFPTDSSLYTCVCLCV